jgi:hypothetical protein
LAVAPEDEGERDVDAARLGGHGLGVLVDGALVGGIDHSGVGAAAGGGDLSGDAFERLERAAGEEHGGALAGERPRYGGPEGAAGAVDDRGLAGKDLIGHTA